MKKLGLNQMESLEVGKFWGRESGKMIRKQKINIMILTVTLFTQANKIPMN